MEAAYISHMCTDKFGRYERSQKNVAQMSVFVHFWGQIKVKAPWDPSAG
jgi:hypothetical protein